MKIKYLSIAIAIGIIFTGCKKNISEEQLTSTNVDIAKIQSWYSGEINKSSNRSQWGKEILAPVNSTTPQWEKTVAIDNNFVTQVYNSSKAMQFLVTSEQNGTITTGHYTFVVSRSAINISAQNICTNSIPEDFDGAILLYDLKGNLLESRHYNKGKLDTKSDKLITKNASPDTQNFVPMAEGCHMETIDWYWQTYVNGVLIYEEYLFSSSSVVCDGQGGGGTTNTSCEQALDAFIAQGHSINGPINTGVITGSETQMLIPYNWLIYSAGTWGLLSYEKATVEKKTYANTTLWEYTDFHHVKITSSGANIGGTRDFVDVDNTINISPSKTSAYVRIDFTVTSKVCNLQPVTIPYNPNKTFHAPNGVVTIPNI